MSATLTIATVLTVGSLGQLTPANEVDAIAMGVRYALLPGSTLTDLFDLSPADPVHPLRGTFVLKRLPTLAPFPTYELRQIRFQALDSDPQAIQVRGRGLLHLFGHFPDGLQQMELHVAINQNLPFVMTSGLVSQAAPFPTIDVEVAEAPLTNKHFYVLKIVAEPIRRLSYSTEFGFTSAHAGPVSDGDLLSSTGRVVQSSIQLAQNLGIMPPTPDIGLDALGRTPASSTILFSAEWDIWSESLGLLQDGDLLNQSGFIAQTNQQLTAAFGPMPIAPDVGLDAYYINLANGEQWFSIEEPLFSEILGVTLQPGDLLSDAGYIVKNNAELLKNFEIIGTGTDPAGFGLDALTRLPNGTLWFSVEEGFLDVSLGWIGHGDVLSDTGHRIRRNLDLVWSFQPLEDLDDFGLDALHVGPVIAALDANEDGVIDLQDYAMFEACLANNAGGMSESCAWADIDNDDRISLSDFAGFQQDYAR